MSAAGYIPHPGIEIRLQLLQRSIDLFPERHAIELVQHRLVEALADPVRLRMPRLGPGVINVLHGQIEFVLMALRGPTVLDPAVGEHTIQRDRLRREERQHPIIQKVGGRHRRRRFPV